jgi:uncharacterized protein YoxC
MKLVCPHCGHDGTPATAKPPVGSVGFNYLADDVVCREVRGREESGRLVLASDVKCDGSGGTNARIECRSCWQTFPIPEGTQWIVASEPAQSASPGPQDVSPETPPVPATSVVHSASERIAQNLAVLLSETVEEASRPLAEKLTSLESGLAELAKGQEEIPLLRRDAEALQQQTGALPEGLQAVRSRLATVETAVAAQAESQPQLWEQVKALAAKQDEISQRAAEQTKALEDLRAQVVPEQNSLRAEHDSLGGRLHAAEGLLQGATASVARIGEVCTQLQEVQQSLQNRLDAQAEAIRLLHGAAQERIVRKEELQAAVQRLEEIAGALGQPKPLPKEL